MSLDSHSSPGSRLKARKGGKAPRESGRKRPTGSARGKQGIPAGLYWLAVLLLLMLVVLIAVCLNLPTLRQALAGEPRKHRHSHSSTPHEDAALQPPAEKTHAPKVTPLKEPAIKEPVFVPAPALSLHATNAVSSTPPKLALEPSHHPVAKTNAAPVAIKPPPPVGISPAPMRALPLDPNKLDTERIAAYQVALERIHFSCGFIDGNQGMRTQRMLRAYQASHALPVSGFLDQPTRDSIGEPGEPFLTYTVTADDLASIMPRPSSWRERSQVKRLGYNDMWELLGEKFHCTRAYLRDLNPGVKTFTAGTEVIGPKVFPASPAQKAASLRVLLGETSIEALNAQGQAIAFFPCSIAADKKKRPNGQLVVKSVVPYPDYTFDPALFHDASVREGLTKKMVLPPGPRNPVGTAWVGLSLPGYGIHGTPEPENISRTQSHGCFRLANWNAEQVLKMVRVGTPVDVEP